MTGSLGEVRAVLARVEDLIGTALAHAGTARDRLADARAAADLADLEPGLLSRAEAEVERGLALMSGGAEAVAALGSRL